MHCEDVTACRMLQSIHDSGMDVKRSNLPKLTWSKEKTIVCASFARLWRYFIQHIHSAWFTANQTSFLIGYNTVWSNLCISVGKGCSTISLQETIRTPKQSFSNRHCIFLPNSFTQNVFLEMIYYNRDQDGTAWQLKRALCPSRSIKVRRRSMQPAW